MNVSSEVGHGNSAVVSVDGAPAATPLGGAAKDDVAEDTASRSCLPPRKRGMRGGKKEGEKGVDADISASIGELTKTLDTLKSEIAEMKVQMKRAAGTGMRSCLQTLRCKGSAEGEYEV